METTRIGHREARSVGDHHGDATRVQRLFDAPDDACGISVSLVVFASIHEHGPLEERVIDRMLEPVASLGRSIVSGEHALRPMQRLGHASR